jgi:uncharacterized protein involved in response to NO
VRREPFRLLFPIAVTLGLAGVLPWLLFGTGLIREWMGGYHALTMTQGFLLAAAAGFLSTMIPRRTGAAPPSSLELALFAIGPLLVVLALFFGRLIWAELAFAGTIGALAQFSGRRLMRSHKKMPPSFVMMPVGLLCALVGAGLLCASTMGANVLAAGRSLAEEGLLFGLVLALGPMLAPILEHGEAASEDGPRWPYLLAAVALAASFAVQHAIDERIGLLVRGAVAGAVVLFGARLWRSSTAPGLHRRLFRLALILVPLGPLAAAARPALRVPLYHLTFVGGLSLLVFAVSFHVTFLHTGREALASRRPLPVLLVGLLTLAALSVRVFAEQVAAHYFGALAIAAGLWLAAALAWIVYILPMLRRA